MAVLACGSHACAVPINHQNTPPEIKMELENVDAKAIIVQEGTG